LEVPPAAARAVVKDMRAFFAAKDDSIKKMRSPRARPGPLNQHLGPRDKKLKLTDVKGIFVQTRIQARKAKQ
jgi:hypothetical protein